MEEKVILRFGKRTGAAPIALGIQFFPFLIIGITACILVVGSSSNM